MSESARRAELLESAYRHVQEHGLVGMSLRPLAHAVGSSPRVLLYLFGSKDGLVRALLERARADELALLRACAATRARSPRPPRRSGGGWPRRRTAASSRCGPRPTPGRSSSRTARGRASPPRTVDDWLVVLADFAADPTERTLVLAVLRGAMLDLLATGDRARITPAVERLTLRGAPSTTTPVG